MTVGDNNLLKMQKHDNQHMHDALGIGNMNLGSHTSLFCILVCSIIFIICIYFIRRIFYRISYAGKKWTSFTHYIPEISQFPKFSGKYRKFHNFHNFVVIPGNFTIFGKYSCKSRKFHNFTLCLWTYRSSNTRWPSSIRIHSCFL